MQSPSLWMRIAQGILILNALFFLITSMIIIFQPHAFQSLVRFDPFNRHYLADAGIFQFAVALNLFWAIPSPKMRVANIWIATIVSFMHTADHIYDLLFTSTPPLFTLWLPQTTGLLILALSLLVVAIGCSRKREQADSQRTGRSLGTA